MRSATTSSGQRIRASTSRSTGSVHDDLRLVPLTTGSDLQAFCQHSLLRLLEKPVRGSADARHHVRLWMTLEKGAEERPVWLGSATFDRGVGISHYTGQITHHIAPNIDAERDLVIAELSRAGILMQIYQVGGVGPMVNGRNGE